MKAPAFWNDTSSSVASKLLSPIATLYSAITGYRFISTTAYEADIPVICIGNYTMGGAGKTPVTENLFLLTKEMGFKPCILSRGYGGEIDGPQFVDIALDNPQKIGDEPYMMAHKAPVMVSKDRKLGAKEIIAKGYDLILMDDGFQNPTLKKDISFIVIDGRVMLGNQKVFPAGPLREPLARALPRTDALVTIGEPAYNVAPLNHVQQNFTAKIEIKPTNLPKKVIAFCGIGLPAKFKDTLSQHGVDVIEFIEFADHHPYSEDDITSLENKAKQLNLPLITTEKDWVKLPKMTQDRIQCLPIRLQWDRPDAVKAYLKAKLTKK